MYRYLATEESVFCEPASAASVAGLLKAGVPAPLGGGLDGRLRAYRQRTPTRAISQIEVPKAVDATMGDILARAGPLTAEPRAPGGGARAGMVAASRPEPVCWWHLRFRTRPVRACGRDLLVRRSRPARARRRGEMRPGSRPGIPTSPPP